MAPAAGFEPATKWLTGCWFELRMPGNAEMIPYLLRQEYTWLTMYCQAQRWTKSGQKYPDNHVAHDNKKILQIHMKYERQQERNYLNASENATSF